MKPLSTMQRRMGFLSVSGGLCAVLVSATSAAPPQAGGKKPAPQGKTTTAAKPTTQTNFSDNTPLTDEQKIVHALNRVGFGPRPGDVEKVKAMGLSAYLDQQLHPETINDTAVEAKLAPFATLSMSGDDLMEQYSTVLKNGIFIKVLRNSLGEGKGAGDKEANAAVMAAKPGGEMMTPSATPVVDTSKVDKKDKRLEQALGVDLDTMTNAQKRAMLQKLTAETIQMGQQTGSPQLQLSTAKMVRAVDSNRQLQEVMVDFWTNHFNIDMTKNQCRVLKSADDRTVIRPLALGKFRDLLGASAHSPAMLVYLDNYQSVAPRQPTEQQMRGLRRLAQSGNPRAMEAMQALNTPNKKAKAGINENYAREIMELHTLGVDGGYSQKDVQEVARCLTGWGISRNGGGKGKGGLGGSFEFHPALHDNGEKTVLGQTIPANGGIADGEKVLDILASHPSTMRFVSRKLCQRFVSDAPPEALVDKCVQTWKATGGDIREIVRTIVTSPEFNSRAAYRQKIKSPFEYAASSVRALGGTYDLTGQALAAGGGRLGGGKKGQDYQKTALNRTLPGQVSTMGETLFQYPFPTGYSENSQKWVSSGALISRLNFSLALAGGQLAQLDLRDAPLLAEAVGGGDPAKTANTIAEKILHGEVSPSTRALLLKEAQAAPATASPAASVAQNRRVLALVLGSPEFQRR